MSNNILHFSLIPTEVTRKQVQLCIRNQDCITDIEEVETDGY